MIKNGFIYDREEFVKLSMDDLKRVPGQASELLYCSIDGDNREIPYTLVTNGLDDPRAIEYIQQHPKAEWLGFGKFV